GRGHSAAGHGAQNVEHLADHGTGQHHDHQTGVGEDVSEVARHAVVHRTDDGGHLAEALGRAALAQQHQAADDEHHRVARHIADACGKETDTRKDDPPGTDVQDGVHHLAPAAQHPEFHRHAYHDLYEAHGQRKDQHGHGVAHEDRKSTRLNSSHVSIS